MLVGERVKAAAMVVAESAIHLVVDRRPTFVVVPTADGSGGVIDDDDLERLRHRNASGSLSSHDYEEMSTASSSASLRSTPTYEQRQHHCGHQQLPYRGHSPRLALDFDGSLIIASQHHMQHHTRSTFSSSGSSLRVHLTKVEQRQVASDPQTKPPDLGCEFACRLQSTTTIAIHYYYSARKLILIYRPTEGRRLS